MKSPRPKRWVTTKYVIIDGERLTYRQIAERLGISRAAVSMRARRGKAIDAPRSDSRSDNFAVKLPESPRICDGCGGNFERRKGESNNSYAKRKACCIQCAGILRRNHRDISTSKSCVKCGKIFRRGRTEGTSTFLMRRCCSRGCANKLRVEHQQDDRTCKACATILTRRAKESLGSYRKRTYCCCKCATIATTKVVEVCGVRLTLREVSEITGEPVGTVRWRILNNKPAIRKKRKQ